MNKLRQGGIKALTAFDWPLLALVILMAVIGMTIMLSGVEGLDWRFADQLRNFFIAFGLMWLVAMVPPPVLKRFAVPFYILGIVLLLGVEFFGETSKGATRWLDLGSVRILQSERMKIKVPLRLAVFFH